MRLAICAPGQSGKDAVCELLVYHHGLTFTGSTSYHGGKIVWDVWGQHRYDSFQTCYDDRRNHRETWAAIICAYSWGDPTRLYRHIMMDSDILQGVRDPIEAQACKDARLCDYWIWIDRDVPPDPTQRFGREMCDYVLDNRGSLDELPGKVDQMMLDLRGQARVFPIPSGGAVSEFDIGW